MELEPLGSRHSLGKRWGRDLPETNKSLPAIRDAERETEKNLFELGGRIVVYS